MNGKRWKDVLKAEAKQRRANRSARGPQEQLDALDLRLGRGVGAARERARLEKELGRG